MSSNSTAKIRNSALGANTMEAKLKHLELVQDVINRLAITSSRVKQWTLAAAIVVLFAQTDGSEFSGVGILIALALGIVILFWFLDGYYLWQERLYRRLYDEIRDRAEEKIDFSMNCQKFASGRRTWFRSTFSPTLGLFYGAFCVCILPVVCLN